MANSVSIQILENGDRNVKVLLSGTIDTSNVSTSTLLDPATLLNSDGTTNSRLIIDKVTYNIEAGLAVDLLWDAKVDSPILSLVNASDELTFRKFGGLYSPTSVSLLSGAINYRTRGWTAGQIMSFSIVVEARKASTQEFLDQFQQVQHILTMWDGSLYLPSPSTCYQNSAGTTQGAVDQPVGLMLDSMGVLGAELLPSFSLLSGWAVSNATIVDEDTLLTPSAGGVWKDVFTAGRTYKLVVSGDSTGGVEFRTWDGTTQTVWLAGFGSAIITVPTAQTRLYIRNSVAGTTNIDNISVREITGNHATQATAGFRPILRGAVKNLVAWSEDLTNAAWGKAAITVAGSVVTATNPLHALYQVFTVVPGITYTYQFKSKRGSMSNQKYSVYNVTGAVDIIPATSYYSQLNSVTDTVVSVTFTAPAGCTSVQIYPLRDSEVVGDCTITENQVEIGSVANPYVPTTTAPASSSYGPYWLDFDGVDDRLQLASVPYQQADSGFVIASSRLEAVTASVQSIVTVSSTAVYNALVNNISYTNTTGYPAMSSRDDAGVLVNNIGTVSGLGVNSVLTSRAVADNRSLRVGGINVSSTSTVLGATTSLNRATIGALTRATTDSFLRGGIYSIALGKGAITDAQLLQLEKYAGSQCGVVI